MAAPLPEVDGDADALVAVVRDGLDLAAAHGDALPDRLRDLGFGRRGAARLRGGEHGFGDALELGGRQREAVRCQRRAAGVVDTNRGGVAASRTEREAVIDGLC